MQVHRCKHHADGLCADPGGKAIRTMFVQRAVVLFLAQQLLFTERGNSRLNDNVALEIENALQFLQRHVEQKTDARWQRLKEPDMRDGGGELDMAHALTAHLCKCHLDTAFLTNQTLVLHSLVLAAQALVILDRPEDARAEKPIPLRLEGAVIYRFGLLDLTK